MPADSAQYLIDIDAEIKGAGGAAAELMALADELEATGAAAEAASAELSASSTAYKQAETGANAAAKQAEKLAQKLAAAQAAQQKMAGTGDAVNVAQYRRAAAKVEKLSKAQTAAAAKAVAMSAALRKEAKALDAVSAKADKAASAHRKAGSAFKAGKSKFMLGEQARRGSGSYAEMAEGLNKLGGPLGRSGGKAAETAEAFQKLKKSLGSAKGGAIGAAIAITVLVVAITAAVLITKTWAIKLADANRTLALTTKAIEANSEELQGLGRIMPSVTRATGLATAELQDLAKQLEAAGVKAKDLPTALRAAAMAEAALGKGGAAKFLEQIKKGKKAVGVLAAEVEKKFGGIVAKRMISLDQTGAKLRRNLAETFGGLNIEPLLKGLSKLADLFDVNTASGQAIKFLFETMFQPLVDGTARAIPTVEAGFLHLEIAALKIYIAYKKLEKSGWLTVVKVGLIALMGPVALVVGGIYAIAAAIEYLPGVAVGAWEGIKSGASAVGEAVSSAASWVANGASDMASAVVDAVSDLPGQLAELGTNAITALVDAIKNGGAAVAAALSDMVSGGVKAAMAALKMDSPSKVFQDIGRSTGEGMEIGVDKSAKGVQSSLSDMVAAPPLSGSSTTTTNNGGHTFNVSITAADADEAITKFKAMLTSVLEGDVTQLGGEGAPA